MRYKMPALKNKRINWESKKDKLKQMFATLTERDLYFEKGKIEEMLSKLQKKLGISRHELYKIFSRL